MVNQKNCKKSVSIFKTILRFLFSNVGLIFMVIGYTIGGAFLFQLLEKHANVQACQEVAGKERKIISMYTRKLYNQIITGVNEFEFNQSLIESVSFNYTDKLFQNNEIETVFKNLRNDLLKITDSYHYYCKVCIEGITWNFQSSLLFALTLITTIGKINY